jgi:hypothetical protein
MTPECVHFPAGRNGVLVVRVGQGFPARTLMRVGEHSFAVREGDRFFVLDRPRGIDVMFHTPELAGRVAS